MSISNWRNFGGTHIAVTGHQGFGAGVLETQSVPNLMSRGDGFLVNALRRRDLLLYVTIEPHVQSSDVGPKDARDIPRIEHTKIR